MQLLIGVRIFHRAHSDIIADLTFPRLAELA